MTVAKESTKWKQVRCGTLAAAMVLLVSVALAQATSAPRARIGANTTASGNPMSYSLYTPELNLMSQTTPSTASNPPIANEYIWFGGQPVAQIDVASNATRSTFTDHLGTPILQTDATGTVIWRAEYDPYGDVRQMRVGTPTDQPLRLPGQELAMTSGGNEENYNITRWYRAEWGRYSQVDPLSPGGVGQKAVFLGWKATHLLRHTRPARVVADANPYSYAAGDPVMFFDPDGLEVVRCVVQALWPHPFGRTCFYGGLCTGWFSEYPYVVGGGVEIAHQIHQGCDNCAPVCRFHSHSDGKIFHDSNPEEWTCEPPMDIVSHSDKPLP